MTTNRPKWYFTAMGLSAALLLAGSAQAGTVSYAIDVSTSGLSGTMGYLDFQFNPGTTPYDSASAILTGFSTDGVLTTPAAPAGDVTGSFPGTVTIGNTDALNEYTPGFTYGSFFDVFVTLDIPTVSGSAAGGNSFSLDAEDSMFNSLLGTFPAVQIDLDATTGNPTITNNARGTVSVTVTPEPASFLFAGPGLLGLALLRGRIRYSR